MNYKTIILESNKRRSIIRTLVRDIVNVFKEEDEGEFYLPNYIKDEDEYYFENLDYGFSVELVISENEDLERFKIDANLYRKDNIIEVNIEYNPNNKTSLMYDIVGELNEVIAHEIRHIDQYVSGSYDLDVNSPEDSLSYYTQKHELDAQVKGFKRISKLTKTPFDIVVKRWFRTHKDIHKLSDDESDIVINKILNYN
jgi:hypothetical protein